MFFERPNNESVSRIEPDMNPTESVPPSASAMRLACTKAVTATAPNSSSTHILVSKLKEDLQKSKKKKRKSN